MTMQRLLPAWLRYAVLALAVCVVPLANAADVKDGAPVASSPPMSAETARDMLSKMSDAEVRKMMLEHLDRAAGAPATTRKPATDAAGAGMSDMMSMVESESARMRERAFEIARAAGEVPQAFATVGARLAEKRPSQPAIVAAFVVATLVAGALLELVLRRATRKLRTRLERTHEGTFTEAATSHASRLLLDLAGLAAFTVGAALLFVVAWQGHGPSRTVALVAVAAVLLVRLVAIVSRFLLSPDALERRLLGVDSARARSLHRIVVAAATVFAVIGGTGVVFRSFGVAESVVAFLTFVLSTIVVGLLIAGVWQSREGLRSWIGGPLPRRPIRQIVAELTPPLVCAYLLVVYFARIDALLSGRDPGRAAILSVLVLVLVPLVDAALCRWLRDAADKGVVDPESGASSFVSAYEPVLRKAIHIVATLVGVLAVARLWDVDLFALAERSVGGRIASALFGIVIVVLIAYLLWQIAFTAIERRMAAETFDHAPASRMRTLLPVLRLTLQITILVVTTLSILAALGINIVPLLAGASIVGVAIGFGSQTLVRDVVSGAFFMMDDAFRLGEYIEVGDAKGRVEKITVRSVFLRHHRGAINILPYGEVKRIRNTSRDWMILVMEFRLTYDTNLNKVKQILKRIGDEIAADPDYANDLLQPLKSQGVMSAEDSALVVRAKFTARPGDAPWVIRRVAYQKILKAFAEEGIKFAHRQVTVHVAGDEDEPPSRKAIAGAAVIPTERAAGG